MLVSALLFSSFSAHAELTSYNSNGVELVYSSISDVTWTNDANLFKTLYDADNTLISKIAAVTPTYNDEFWGVQTLGIHHFNTTGGQVTWWGALAFVNYLNSINYGGSDQWRLPTVENKVLGYNTSTNGIFSGDELPELFYQELGGIEGNTIFIHYSEKFENVASGIYHSGTAPVNYDYAGSGYAWNFHITSGYQGGGYKDSAYFAWAVTSGQVAAVPEANTLAMLLAGLGVLGAVMRRRRI